jgi:hypothetical protein
MGYWQVFTGSNPERFAILRLLLIPREKTGFSLSQSWGEPTTSKMPVVDSPYFFAVN